MSNSRSPLQTSVPNLVLKLTPFVLILLYVSLALIKIVYPGLQYDEILWGNAALGGIDRTFILFKLGDIPVLLMPYIGAVKSYIYYPIFKLFGTSVLSIRIPTILLTAASLYLLFSVLRQSLNRNKALAVLFLFSIDPSFISQTRVDCGPIVIEFCCKVAALFFLLKLSQQLKYKYLFGLYVVLAVGVFNKLNFMWFVNSFFFAVAVVYWKEFRALVLSRTGRQRLILLFSNILGCSILYGYYLVISKTFGLTKQFIFPFSRQRLTEIYLLVRNLISGESFFDYALGDIHSPANTVYFMVVVLLLAAGAAIALFNRGKVGQGGIVKTYAFFWIIFITTVLQISVTEQASANWHMFSVYPSITILIATSLFLIGERLDLQGKALACAAAIVGVVVFCYCTGMNLKYFAAYDKPSKNISWSNAIYELTDFTRNTPYRFVSVDWGTQAQLITLHPVKDKYYEICYGLDYGLNTNVPGGAQAVMHALLHENNDFAFIMHPPQESTYPEARQEMFYNAEYFGKRLNLIKTIMDGGRVVFEIYVVQNKT